MLPIHFRPERIHPEPVSPCSICHLQFLPNEYVHNHYERVAQAVHSFHHRCFMAWYRENPDERRYCPTCADPVFLYDLACDQGWRIVDLLEREEDRSAEIAALLQEVEILVESRGDAVKAAARFGQQAGLDLLLQNGPISQEDRFVAVIIAFYWDREEIIHSLLAPADNPGRPLDWDTNYKEAPLEFNLREPLPEWIIDRARNNGWVNLAEAFRVFNQRFRR